MLMHSKTVWGACGLPGSRQDLTGGACGVGGEGVAHRDAASGLGCAVVDQSLHEAVHLGLLPTGVGESGRRGRRSARAQADAPAAVPEAQGEVRELGARAGGEAVGGFQPGTPEGPEAHLRVAEHRISNESQMRRIRALGSPDGEASCGRGGEWGYRRCGEGCRQFSTPLPPAGTSPRLIRSVTFD